DGNSAATHLEADARAIDATERVARGHQIAGAHRRFGEAGGDAGETLPVIEDDDDPEAAERSDPPYLTGGGRDDARAPRAELDAAANHPRVCARVVVAAEGCDHVALDRAQERAVARRLGSGEGGAGGVGLEARDVGLGGGELGAEDLPLLEIAENHAAG